MLTHHSWKRGNILPAALFAASGLPVHTMADGQSDARQLLTTPGNAAHVATGFPAERWGTARMPADLQREARVLLSMPGNGRGTGPVFESRATNKDAHAKAACLLSGHRT